MIGHVIGWYEDGRRDAAAGVYRPRSMPHENAQKIYRTAHRDERKRMAAEGRLPQLRLVLTP